MPRTSPRKRPPADDAADVVAAIQSIAIVLAQSPPPTTPATPSDAEQLLAALALLRWARDQITGWEPRLISAAREINVSWADLALALGVTSRQAAERRYLRLNRATSDEPTAEGRVQAVRHQRAGERAVNAWARANAAEIRQLAGQVSGTDGLTAKARRGATDLRAALAADNPALLLPLLNDMTPHLRKDHTKLADHIDKLTQTAHQQQAPER